MEAHGRGSVFLPWNLEVRKEIKGKLTRIQKHPPVTSRGTCAWQRDCATRTVVTSRTWALTTSRYKARKNT